MGIEFEIDLLQAWQNFIYSGSNNPAIIAWQVFIGGGWVVFLVVVIYLLYLVWLDIRQGQFAGRWKHIILAIDIPRNNEQTPKAVENVFIALAGAQSAGNLIDRYWHGKVQESFSFEIVSLEGYIQFLIRTPGHFRDLIEASIYAQYPDAEITEVDDYTEKYKNLTFPNAEYDLWGTEMVLVKEYPYPIRTYPEWEHSLTQTFLDPMAGLLEILSRFSQGEQVWLQFVVTPQPPGWGERAKKVVQEMRGEEYEPPEHWTSKFFSKPIEMVSKTVDIVTSAIAQNWDNASNEKTDNSLRMLAMSPGTRLVLESVEKKLSKHSFRVKFRLVYFAKKEIFHKGRGVAAVIGAIQQFNTADANGFKPGGRTKTAVDYFFIKRRLAKRQRAILRHYVNRSNFYGESIDNEFLNTEELASLWHFPVMTVKASAVEMIASKKVVSPSRLPISEREFEIKKSTLKDDEQIKNEKVNSNVPMPPLSAPEDLVVPRQQMDSGSRTDEPPGNLPVA